ncbi:hypothetical protein [Nocardia tengchongensis]|uniref:hypothetical protein n=1 Tax=Nocardia tengchongensis TaxID=2055889 RepID=UPI00367C8617
MTTNAPEFDQIFATRTGHPFTVRYVPAGSPLITASGKLRTDAASTVEFCDAAQIGTPAAHGHPAGQFTGTSYYTDTLLGLDKHDGEAGGLALAGGVDAWTIDADTMTDIRAWIAEHGAPSAAKARILAGHPVRNGGLRAQRHTERYGPAEAFRPYTAPGGIECGWYARHGTADCGHEYTNTDAHGRAGIGPGYAIDPTTDQSHCYRCSDDRTRADLDSLTHGPGRVAAYVSNDGRTLTTWNGGELARVIDHRRGRTSDWWKFERGSHTFYGFNAGPGNSIMVRAYSTPANPPAVIPKPDDDALPPPEHP